jgi:hypothetical protein
MTEMDSGKMLQLVPLKNEALLSSGSGRPGSARPLSLTSGSTAQVFYLTGANEGKASRFMEDFVKAKVEGRFPDDERDSQKWEARCANGLDLTVFSALFEHNEQAVPGRGPPARIRVLIDPGKSGLSIKAGMDGIDIAASVSTVGEGFYRLEVLGPNDFSTKDHLTAAEFLPVLTKRSKSHPFHCLQQQSSLIHHSKQCPPNALADPQPCPGRYAPPSESACSPIAAHFDRLQHGDQLARSFITATLTGQDTQEPL